MPSALPTLDPDVLAQVAGALVVMTPDGEIVSWDRGAEILFGFSPEEALGRSIFDLLIPPDRAAATREQIQKALAIGTAGYESERLRKDGSSLPVAISMRPVKDAGGRTLIAKNDRDISHLLTILRDITERKRSEQALREAQQRLQHVVSSSPSVLYSLTAEGRKLVPRWVSANVDRFTAYPPQEVQSS